MSSFNPIEGVSAKKLEGGLLLLFLLLSSLSRFAEAQPVTATFLYTLSDFTGPIPYNWARLVSDRTRREVYVLYQNTIRVFSESGMEIYRFGDDLDLGYLIDAAIDRKGDIYLLAYQGSQGQIIRCNYRGEPRSKVSLRDLPEGFSKFSPNRLVYHDDRFYFASLSEMKVVVTDSEGRVERSHDLVPLLELEEKDRGNVELSGFGVDREGNILFTVPVLFKAGILSRDGNLRWFGRPGSTQGKFNVVAGIARDRQGHFLVVDKLKCAVLVFDPEFRFMDQFGYRGSKPGNLIAPDDIAVDEGDRVYVTQAARRGVSVYRLSFR